MKTGYLVADIMTNNPIKVDGKLSVKECAEVMKNNDVGSVLIMKGNELLGIVTEKDIVFKVTVNNEDASKTTAYEIMTPKNNMTIIEPNKDIYDALIVMKENKVRRLPVLSQGNLMGLITVNDILKIEPDLFDIMVERISLREEERKMNLETNEDYEDEDNI